MFGANEGLLYGLLTLIGFFFSTEKDFLPEVEIDVVSIFFFKSDEIVSVFFYIFIHNIIYTLSL